MLFFVKYSNWQEAGQCSYLQSIIKWGLLETNPATGASKGLENQEQWDMLPPPLFISAPYGWLLYINTVLFSQNSYKIWVLVSLISSWFGSILGGSRTFQRKGGGGLLWVELWSCRINGALPKMLQFENWSLIHNCQTRNTSNATN